MFYDLVNSRLGFFIPLGFIGIYRWLWYVVKIIAYLLYKPKQPNTINPKFTCKRDVTIIVPTIDNGPEIKEAIETWVKSNPYEIIFVTIEKNVKPLEVFSSSSLISILTGSCALC